MGWKNAVKKLNKKNIKTKKGTVKPYDSVKPKSSTCDGEWKKSTIKYNADEK